MAVDRRGSAVPRVIGHRGAAGHAPENTLASIRKAAALGVRWVEVDARLSRDRHVILFHDDTLERTTNGRGRVAKMDLGVLETLDAGGWFGEAFRGEPIPTLRAALAAFGQLGLGANIEIKPDRGRETETGEAVGRSLQVDWPPSLPPPILSSFREDALAAAHAVAPDYERALLVVSVPKDWRRRIENLGCRALHCAARRLTRRLAAEVVAAGFELRCYTVNNAALATKLYRWGIASVFSDFPDRLLLQDGKAAHRRA